ncbi:TadE/TadG family type IV pilus assembly protein [Pseudovibrio sp. JE062]|uniref:TadE/TadG family type IV pilus assembly protein n=1 Tax=Pseudovibrio sp. JE062 TaxID=439495 RepID=UPI000186C7FA|nr:TadE/TadG family type IV pilus assembly protein [Pseudovibrio sp. JE062]EEA92290.1 hypothetical protein PJE062_4380 [Pseudovibrio sp. JE062]
MICIFNKLLHGRRYFSRAEKRKTQCLVADQSGLAALEFALMLPLVMVLFLGMVEMVTALSHDRRVSKTAFSVADLVARSTDVSSSMGDIEIAIAHQMKPFDANGVGVRVGMVRIVKDTPEVIWSWSNPYSSPWTKGNEPTGIPFSQGMLVNGQTYVVTEASLEHSLILGDAFDNIAQLVTSSDKTLAAITLRDTFILHPRKVSCVEYKDSCT